MLLKKHIDRSNHSKVSHNNVYSRNGGLECLAAAVLLITLLVLMLYFLSTRLNSNDADDFDEDENELFDYEE